MAKVQVKCSVDGRVVGRGGVKGPPALCSRCYVRRRRGLPDSVAPAYDGDRTEKLACKVNPQLAKAVRKAAKASGLSVSTWLEKTVEQKLANTPIVMSRIPMTPELAAQLKKLETSHRSIVAGP